MAEDTFAGMQGLTQQSSELMPMAMWCTGMLILPLHLPGKWTIGILTLVRTKNHSIELELYFVCFPCPNLWIDIHLV
jgi:hypothetical protein